MSSFGCGRRSRVVPIAISLVGAAGAVVGGVLGSAAGLACGVMVIVVGWLAWRGVLPRTRPILPGELIVE